MPVKPYIPNCLSIFRAFLGGGIFWSIKEGYVLGAVTAILAAGLSDFLDGFLARRWGVTSRSGMLLDPLADKVCINLVMWGLVEYVSGFTITSPTLWLAALLSLRDAVLFLGSCCILVKQIRAELAPILLSKVCTAMLFGYVLLLIILKSETRELRLVGCVISLLVVFTFIKYIRRALLVKHRHKQ